MSEFFFAEFPEFPKPQKPELELAGSFNGSSTVRKVSGLLFGRVAWGDIRSFGCAIQGQAVSRRDTYLADNLNNDTDRRHRTQLKARPVEAKCVRQLQLAPVLPQVQRVFQSNPQASSCPANG